MVARAAACRRNNYVVYLHRAQDRQVRLALLYLDIDRFKRINDSLGHAVGDGQLKEVARRVRAALHVQDEVAGLGGDEFVILIEDIDEPAATARLAHSLLESIRTPLEVEGQSLYVTISIGVCVFTEDGTNPTTPLKKANAAMYLAKQSGRDSYRYFTAAMARKADARFALETSLRPALEARQMRILYQPKVALADGQVIGAEALVRWLHPSEGLLSPDLFLGAAG